MILTLNIIKVVTHTYETMSYMYATASRSFLSHVRIIKHIAIKFTIILSNMIADIMTIREECGQQLERNAGDSACD